MIFIVGVRGRVSRHEAQRLVSWACVTYPCGEPHLTAPQRALPLSQAVVSVVFNVVINAQDFPRDGIIQFESNVVVQL